MSSATLPEMLDFHLDENGSRTVIARLDLPPRSLFGPFVAPLIPRNDNSASKSPFAVVNVLENGRTSKLDIFTDSEQDCNWMKHVRFTLDRKSCNVVAVQFCDAIYFIVVEKISIGEELVVSYSEAYSDLLHSMKVESLKHSVAFTDGFGTKDGASNFLGSSEESSKCDAVFAGQQTSDGSGSESELDHDSDESYDPKSDGISKLKSHMTKSSASTSRKRRSRAAKKAPKPAVSKRPSYKTLAQSQASSTKKPLSSQTIVLPKKDMQKFHPVFAPDKVPLKPKVSPASEPTGHTPVKSSPSTYTCRDRQESFSTPKEFVEHMATHAVFHIPGRHPRGPRIRIRPRKLYACKYCDVELIRPELRQHYKSHMLDGKYPCPKNCGSMVGTFKKMEDHMKAKHGPALACDVCGHLSGSKSSLAKHVQRHEGKTFDCAECGELLRSEKSLRDHVSELHGEDPTKERCANRQVHRGNWDSNFFKCTECQLGFAFRNAFVIHLDNMHPNVQKMSIPELMLPTRAIEVLKCRVSACKRLVLKLTEIEEHLSKHTEEELAKARERKVMNEKDVKLLFDGAVYKRESEMYYCHYCERPFASPRHFLHHCKSAHPEYHDVLMPHMPRDVSYMSFKSKKRKTPEESDDSESDSD